MNIDLLNRFKGTLVGVHVGDSIGAPYEETFRPAKIAEDIAARGGLVFFNYANPWAKDGNGAILPAGRPTDDSEQTACLAASLLECGSLDTRHLYRLLQESVFDQKSLLWKGRSTGAGGTTKNALSGDRVREEQARNNPIGTNGSLMRCSPMALWFARDIFDISNNGKFDSSTMRIVKQAVHDMSLVTHTHPHSKTACWLYTIILSSLLAGNDPLTALGDVDDIDPNLKCDPMTIRIGSRLNDPYERPYDPGAFPMRGTAEFSLYVALYALMHSTSFSTGIEIAIRVGGDTDTYAAIAGGLLGAHYGYDAIPPLWRQTILGHDPMVKYAAEIYERQTIST